MEQHKKPTYKYCIVPECKNTIANAPDKVFFLVPRGIEIRRMWCKIIKRNMISPSTPLYCCEDHFNVEEDTDNYIKYKIMSQENQKIILRLKKGILPHKFQCRNDTESQTPPEIKGLKRKHQEIIEEEQTIEDNDNTKICKPGCSTSVYNVYDKKLSISQPSMLSSSLESEKSSDLTCIEDDSDKETQFKNQMVSCMLAAVEKNPKMLLGLPKRSYYLIKFLSENIPLPTIDILITLKKIKLNESFSILALQFGYTQSKISRIFSNSIPLLSEKLKELIVWPTPTEISKNLPTTFRGKYSNVVSIIDCLEIQIEKPSNAVNQSQYEKCNTLKYLISCTPDGLVNFVSVGYSGEATDVMIVEESGFLECLPPKTAVLVDRGSYGISHLLQEKDCTLERLPSESPSTKNVKLLRRIASLRIHIECILKRLREYHMLLPDACVDHDLVPIVDNVVIVACGLINTQYVLSKCKFQCRNDTDSQPSPERKGSSKRKHQEIIEKALTTPPVNQSVNVQIITKSSLNNHLEADSSSYIQTKEDNENKKICKPGCSTSVHNVYDEKLSISQPSVSSSSLESEKSSDLNCIEDDSEKETQLKNQMLSCMLAAVEKNPKMLLGLPKRSYCLIKLLSEHIPLPIIDILITLKKIKLNESFSILALQFGYTQSKISRIFSKSVPLLSEKMKELIVWPTPTEIAKNLPTTFNAMCSNVVSIIDCLEIQIEKPSNAVNQSQYEKCNTLKYLISCTPDGLVNFVSVGYNGEATDVMIVKESGFLESLPPKTAVLVDRSFHGISHLLQEKDCTLERLPSESPSTKNVKLLRRIASLRIHIECILERLREYHMLLPDACVDHDLVPIIDNVVIVACGLINTQYVLLKCKLQCRNYTDSQPSPERKGSSKRKHQEIIEEALTTPPVHQSVNVLITESPLNNHLEADSSSSSYIQTIEDNEHTFYNVYDKNLSISQPPVSSSSFESEKSSDLSCIEDDLDKEAQLKNQLLRCMLTAVEKNPKRLLGLPKRSYYLIRLLSENIPLPTIDILITLRKIKLNESSSILALQFGYTQSKINRIFSKSIPLLSEKLKELIVWPTPKEISKNLPISFRGRYTNVVSKIDCLRIQIKKPNAVNQSRYKKCNTLKYLISCTPDGLVNFVSVGYNGKATDKMIIEKSGFLEFLPPKTAVLVDRGFRGISHLLREKDCTLKRLPSKSPSIKYVKLLRRIAALRIQMERILERLREFHMLLPDACVDHNLVPIIDNVVIVACGLINTQYVLIKK